MNPLEMTPQEQQAEIERRTKLLYGVKDVKKLLKKSQES
jgi:hypothetical protein|tara:strand:+ start:114 stop:230 length:117 start_codon:yes stop_codon:yes gene_type:complete